MRRPSPLLLSAAAPPLVILAVGALLWLIAGAWLGFIVLAIGLGGVIVHHVRNLDALTHWAEGGAANVPEGTGVWRTAFSALYRRARTTRAHERDLAHTIERFQS